MQLAENDYIDWMELPDGWIWENGVITYNPNTNRNTYILSLGRRVRVQGHLSLRSGHALHEVREGNQCTSIKFVNASFCVRTPRGRHIVVCALLHWFVVELVASLVVAVEGVLLGLGWNRGR